MSTDVSSTSVFRKTYLTVKGFKLLMFISIFGSCASRQSSLSQSKKDRIIQDARQTLYNYYSDIQKEGLLAEFKYLDSSTDFFWIPPGYLTPLSFDSVAAILNRNSPLYKSIVNSWDTLRIIPITTELATYTGRLHSKMIDNSNRAFEFELIESGVLTKRDGKWKLLSGQTSTIN